MRKSAIASVAAGAVAGLCAGYVVSPGSYLVTRDEGPSAASTGEAGSGTGRLTGLDEPDRLPAGSEWLTSALARIDELGGGAAAIERVAGDLSDVRGRQLRLLAIGVLAARDLPAALAYALTLDPPTLRTAALRRVAGLAADMDPAHALDEAALIPHSLLRREFAEHVLEAWAAREPASARGYIQTADLHGLDLPAHTLRLLWPDERDWQLSVLSRFGSGLRAELQRGASDELLVSDPGIAYAYADMLPAEERTRALIMLVRNHSRLDAKQALAQVLRLDRPPSTLKVTALAAVAAQDFPYAFDKAIELLLAGNYQDVIDFSDDSLLGAIVAAASPSDVAAALDRVAHHPDQRIRRQLNGWEGEYGMLARWGEADPKSAVQWAIRNASLVSSATIEAIGKTYGATSEDRAFARQVLYDLPPDLRGYWMAGVAEGLSASSLDEAVDWLALARGTPVYATVADRVLERAASAEPEAVARVIDGMPDAPGDGLVINVAANWARREPVAAADWVVASENTGEGRAMALRQVVLSWAERDPQKAKAWVLEQSTGTLRDAALAAVMLAKANAEIVDRQLLVAFSSETARADAIVGAMDAFRRSDPALGRSLIDRYLFDPARRDAAEKHLEGRAPPERIRVIGGVVIR